MRSLRPTLNEDKISFHKDKRDCYALTIEYWYFYFS